MTPTVVAYVGLGGNVGAVAETLRLATQALDALPGIRVKTASRFYRTPAWGVEDQPDFINAVVAVETTLEAQVLLQSMLRIEVEFGRHRAAGERWGPRTLDLDLLLYGDSRIDVPGLSLPHPRLHERAFVLVPLLEIAPDIAIPGQGPARDALSRVEAPGITLLG